MAKDRIAKTLLVLEKEEIEQILQIAVRKQPEEIQTYMLKVFIKKVEAALRRRCGGG
jgi:hypothetical protein